MPKMRAPFTLKQEKLIQGVLAGKTQVQAYADAYDCSKMTRDCTRKRSSHELGKPHIRKELERRRAKINKEVEKKIVYSKLESFKEYQRIKELEEKKKGDANLNISLKAEEMRGKLAGLYEEEEREKYVFQGQIQVNFVDSPKE